MNFKIQLTIALIFTLVNVVISADIVQMEPDFNKIVFVKRYTYTANHYYTQHLNSDWTPGGNICTYDLKTKKVVELVPELKGGVFGRFDLDFDASHIVFSWKKGFWEGYRIYEIEIDLETGKRVGELKQLSFPQKDEDDLIAKYGTKKADGGQWDYHHGTEDMDPCYLPDGNIAFVSTRCQYGTLCDAPDVFATTTIYRMNRDGSNMKQLSFGSLNEFTPVVLPDGRIMYSRWEYVDKGAVSTKCLWAMRPDGSGSLEIYGNDIASPTTMIQARPLPGKPGEYVMLGTPHCPQNQVGTVIKLDMSKNIRTSEPMTYVSKDIEIKFEPGFDFNINDEWINDKSGKKGRLFSDPYPLTENTFLVARKKAGKEWKDATAYDLVWLDEKGNETLLYKNSKISCFQPFPLKTRKRPPVLPSILNPELAKKGLATCVVTDIYHGLEDIPRGTVKFIRILEQVPRPWAARRFWDGDNYDQQHATITKDTHLGLKVQHGIVPVETDGSAHFVVPANKNIFFQALDENYMAVQTERTFVNYMPGESSSCIGCHETPNSLPTNIGQSYPLALKRPPSEMGPQPGESAGQRPIDFAMDVQPVLNKHCVECHSGMKPKGGMNLSGEETQHFSVSYESLIEARRDEKGRSVCNSHRIVPESMFGRKKDQQLLVGPTIGENHPKDRNVKYMPAKSFGSHTSILVSMLAPDKVQLVNQEDNKRAVELAEKHKEIKLTKEELLRITNWVDTNAQFYGMYWGRKNLKYKDHPNYRPIPTFERASSMVSQIPESTR
jgi:hypothetical protein